MALNVESINSGQSRQRRFCALEYRPQDRHYAASRSASIVLFVLRDEEGNLSFLVHPELRNILRGTDLDYLDSLLWDCVERAKQHPEDLFNQLSSLGVGPLVTHEVGSNISDDPSLSDLCSGFVQL